MSGAENEADIVTCILIFFKCTAFGIQNTSNRYVETENIDMPSYDV